ncbi:MAG: hypothetical protein IJ438_08295 [Clostridia bacterium]|nr:hypothetical protein [Clostridia bacterium]
MRLYHGSSLPNLRELRPFRSNHEKPYVYLSDSATLALIYAHNPLTRPNGFFPYYFRDGQLHYDEYFPAQTRILYQGHGGCVYTCNAENVTQLDKMPWVYLSETPVPVAESTYIPDLYDALMEAASDGRLILHRYEDAPEAARAMNRRIVRRSLEEHHHLDDPEDEYVQFLHRYMPEIF